MRAKSEIQKESVIIQVFGLFHKARPKWKVATYLIRSLFLIATSPLTFLWLCTHHLGCTHFCFRYNFCLFRPHRVLAWNFWMMHGRVLRIYESILLVFIRLLWRFLLLLCLLLGLGLSLIWYHSRLTRWRLEISLILSCRSRCALDYHGLPNLINILSTLILVHLGFLMKSCNILSCRDHLLATTQILNISATLGWLLPLLLLARIMIILLWDRVLLRILLNGCVALRVMEACLRLHRVICSIRLGWHQGHFVSTRTRRLSRILTAIERLICRATCRATRGISARSVPKALMIASIHVLFAWRRSHIRHLHRL